MGKHSIEELLPKADWSIYRLVRMASKRALELSEGKPSLVKKNSSDKETTIAMDEIRQGKVVYKNVADKFTPAPTNNAAGDSGEKAV